MLKLKSLALMAFLALGLNANAEYISASSSGAAEPYSTLMYAYHSEDGPVYDQFYYTSYTFAAWYDTDTGEGSYAYTVYGPNGSISISMDAAGGVWSYTSWYEEGFWPYFVQGFWSEVY